MREGQTENYSQCDYLCRRCAQFGFIDQQKCDFKNRHFTNTNYFSATNANAQVETFKSYLNVCSSIAERNHQIRKAMTIQTLFKQTNYNANQFLLRCHHK